ncbi:Conserved hypothetical protein [gamma proteobacterium HdN1]|nr:Conserved hypothetical protein [gamma proteobacterium HdN1]
MMTLFCLPSGFRRASRNRSMNTLRQATLSLPFVLMMSGCATEPTQPPAAAAQPSSQQAENHAESKVAETRPFDPETLFELLVAEFAGKRDRADLALSTYLQTAHRTRDPAVAERATSIARYLGADQQALDAALLWAKVDPNNPAAHEAAATLLIRFNRLDPAMDHIDALLSRGIELNFDFLLNATRHADPQTLSRVAGRLNELVSKYPENAQIWFTRGLIRHEQDNTQGLDDIDRALELEPTYVNAIIAKARLLEERGGTKAARKALAHAVKQQPDSKRLGLSYARLLLRQKRIDDAQKEFSRLVAQFPEDTDLALSLALVAWENDAEGVAETQLKKLVDTERSNEAHTYLGRIAAAQHRNSEAVEQFSLVNEGPLFTAARMQMAALLASDKQVDEACQTLARARQRAPQDSLQLYMMESEILSAAGRKSDALNVLEQTAEQYPENLSVLYAKGMMYGDMDQWEPMEQTMRKILALDPNNADAMNALGYTLADRNIRLDEAYQLISKALSLTPNNPAVLDSMGWVKFRRGDLTGAVELLRAAYKDFPDPEVAAHLGEALWASGNQKDAAQVWNDALKKSPNNPLILNAVERSKASQALTH